MKPEVWKNSRYGTWTLDLGLVQCSVWWSTDRGRKYDAQVGPHRLKKDFATVEDAKRAAEDIAHQLLTHAMDTLSALLDGSEK